MKRLLIVDLAVADLRTWGNFYICCPKWHPTAWRMDTPQHLGPAVGSEEQLRI